MRTLAIVLVAAAAAGLRLGAQPPAPDPAALVERAGKYVDGYVEAFSAIVSEESQAQKLIRPDGSVRKVREITADFLLVKARGTWPEAYRDVLEVRSTYASFRKFQVTTGEQIKTPK